MSSRAKKKRKSKGLEPKSDPPAPPDTSDWPGEEGVPLTKSQERWLDMFFAAVLGFICAGGGIFWLSEMWILALAAGTIGGVVAVVLLRRGVTLW